VSVTSDDDLTAIALSPAEHYHLSMEGDWRDGRGGGCKNHPSWRNNPQYHFKVRQAPVKLYALLSQPETEEDMPHIGYYLLKNEGAVLLRLWAMVAQSRHPINGDDAYLQTGER
jgi:hypothetical protein